MPQMLQQPESDAQTTEQRQTEVRGWLDDARGYLSSRFVNDLEAGLKRFDPTFSFTPAEKARLQNVIDEILKPGGGIVLEFKNKGPLERGAWCDVQLRRVHINPAMHNSQEQLLKTLTHELLHHISYVGSPFLGFAEIRILFEEGSTEFLTYVILSQNREITAGYPIETLKIYALIKGELITVPAFLRAFLGNSFRNEFAAVGDPEGEFVFQLEAIKPGAVESLFQGLGYWTYQTIAFENVGYISREIEELSEILNAGGVDADAVIKSGAEELGIGRWLNKRSAEDSIDFERQLADTDIRMQEHFGVGKYVAPNAGYSLHAHRVRGEGSVTFEIWSDTGDGGHVLLGTKKDWHNSFLETWALYGNEQIKSVELIEKDGSYTVTVTLPSDEGEKTLLVYPLSMVYILAALGYTVEQFTQMSMGMKAYVFREAARVAALIGVSADEV